MGRARLRAVDLLLLSLPLCFLLLYLFRAPLLVPGFILPERAYLALSRQVGASGLLAARERVSSGEVFAVLPDRLLALPAPSAAPLEWEALARLLPERPSLGALRAELEAGLPLLRRARLLSDFVPTAAETRELSALAREGGLPLALEAPHPASSPSRLSAFSWRAGDTGDSLPFEVLLSPEAPGATELSVSALRGQAEELLWRGAGSALPADRVLRLSTLREGLSGLLLDIKEGGRTTRLRLEAPAESSADPRILVVTGKGQTPSYIESLYATLRLSPAEAAGRDLADYELVVIDGVPLRSLDAPFTAVLADYARQGLGSLLFAADSPDFGAKGDSPRLEELLPVTLLPPSLKDLPDMAMLILLDYSGSMFGGKLSLAKVASLELLKGLKPGDRVGLLLFSDRRNWVWDFPANSEIVAAPILEPVEAEGGTELAPALEEGLARLGAVPLKEKHIVVISDGVTRPADFQALAARAREAGISISTMGVGPDQDRALLERLALQSGGHYYLVENPEAIPSLLFEDRMSQARPIFAQGSIPILDISGSRVATIGGMAQYAAKKGSSVLFSNDVGDPLFSSFESGNRAVMVFASDLYGTYTAEFFARRGVAAIIRDRLDSLFASRPPEIAVLESSRAVFVSLRSDSLVQPRLRLSRAGEEAREFSFERAGAETWNAELVLPLTGRWRASLLDRQSSLVSFDLVSSLGIGGVDEASVAALRDWKSPSWRRGEAQLLWLLLLFASSLGATLLLRLRR